MAIQFQKKKVNIWVAIAIVFVLISLIIVYFQSNDSLGVYTGSTTTTTATTTEGNAPKIDLVTYTNEEHHYTIGVPNDWTKIMKDGKETYIHQPSGTMVQVQVQSFSPQIFNVNQTDLKNDLANSGYNLLSLNWVDNSSYTVVYDEVSTAADSPTSLHIAEATLIDYNKIIRLVFEVEKQYQERMNDTIIAIIDSFTWEKESPLPSGVWMYYSTNGKFQFAYPDGWNTSASGNTYIAQDPTTGAVMSVTANQSTVIYDNLTQTDYMNFAASGRTNFVLTGFTHNGNIIYGEGNYSLNNTPMTLIQYLMATGEYEYTLSFEVPQSTLSSQSQLIQTMVDSFRLY